MSVSIEKPLGMYIKLQYIVSLLSNSFFSLNQIVKLRRNIELNITTVSKYKYTRQHDNTIIMKFLSKLRRFQNSNY